jgi:TonB-linked SusC/RagA family outer membrane protein
MRGSEIFCSHPRMHLLLFLLFALTISGAKAQNSTIKGVVKTTSGETLPGVTILEKGSTNGTVTDLDGAYEIGVSSSRILLFSSIGMKSQEIPVANQSVINVILEDDLTQLEEVMVVGYGTMKKSDLTGAVASVNAADLNTLPTGNIVEALQGKIAGVDIGAVTSPGQTPSVRIRGNRSLNASNEPLYVVDGIPRNTISDLPVSDIESIEVLKDAASTAIYGSRGANGVILVTTKRAKLNAPTEIAVSSYVGINQPKMPELMSGEEYVQFRRDIFRANQNSGWASGEPDNALVFAPRELETVNKGNFVDWQDLLFRNNTLNQEHNLGISHGSDKTQMLFSLGYRTEEGYYKTNDMERFNLGINVDHSISDMVKIGISSRLTHTQINGFTTPEINLLYMNPVSQPYDEEGRRINNPSVQQTAAWNILANYEEPYINRTINLRSFNVLYAEINPMEGLTLRSNLGIDIDNREGQQYHGSQTTLRYGRLDFAEKTNQNTLGITWDNIVSYVRDFGKHNINGTFVSSLQQQTRKNLGASGEGMPGESIEDWNLASATQNILISSGFEKWSIASLLGRFQYGYDHRYLINVSFRADGSSVLAEGNKWGYFPAASAAWVISEEGFYEPGLINYLKFRTSYGVVGNSAISPYATLAGTSQTTYNFGDAYYFGYKLSGLVNKSLGWEYSKTFNLGLDFGIFNDRVNGSIEFYNTRTTDLLMQRSLPNFTGSSSIYQNVGSTSNTGFEVMLSSINVDNLNFKWTSDFNFYTNKEKILSLLDNEDMVGNRWFIGQPTRVYYDYEKLGIWQLDEADEAANYNMTPGDVKLKNQNPEEGYSIDAENDRIILGQQSPKFGLFLRNSLEYKGLTFSFAFEGKFGHKVSSDILGGMIFLDGTRWGPKALAGNYWTPDNPEGEYPYVNRAVEPRINLFGIRNGSYINVQELSLGYSFKQLEFVKNLMLYARVKNPFYIYQADKAIDPQAPNYDLSAYRTYVVGLNFNF